jgi:hypothetical protein
MSKFIDLTGQRFGRLTVLGLHHSNNGAYWLCKCECGRESVVRGANLRRGATKSCGCGSVEQAKKNCEKCRCDGHQMSKTRIYEIWKNMKRRCYASNNKRYANYGGRGVKVCDEWLHDFPAFYDWAVANGYSDDLTIDRTDVNGNYEPSNCRWATRKEQANNQTRNHYITYKGETKTLKQWSETFGIPYGTFQHRVQRGWSMERIVETPVRRSVNGHYVTSLSAGPF